MEYSEQLEKWFDELNDWAYLDENRFENLKNKPYPAEQICAVMFLYGKLKPENKDTQWFFHGERDILYIGASYDVFEEFKEEDVKTALTYGIRPCEDGDGFQIYASM